jgi:hypothetical protein
MQQSLKLGAHLPTLAPSLAFAAILLSLVGDN